MYKISITAKKMLIVRFIAFGQSFFALTLLIWNQFHLNLKYITNIKGLNTYLNPSDTKFIFAPGKFLKQFLRKLKKNLQTANKDVLKSDLNFKA